MTVGLVTRLVASGVVSRQDVEAALHDLVTLGRPVLKTLAQRHPDLVPGIENELGRSPMPVEPRPVADDELFHRLPPDLCYALLALPLERRDAESEVVVAVADPYDRHAAREVSFHLKVRVKVVRSPLMVLLEALGARERGVGDAAQRPTRRRRLGTPPRKPNRKASDPPIPLVRVSPHMDTRPPSTLHGVAPPPGLLDPTPATARRRRATASPAEAFTLTRPRNEIGNAPADPRSVPDEQTAVPGSEPVDTLEGLATARSAKEIVGALVRGLEVVASHVIVFVNRGGVFKGRAGSTSLGGGERVRRLSLAADAPSVLKTAAQTGQYLGPLPRTKIHDELAAVLDCGTGQVTVHPVTVSQRAVLVVVLAGLTNPFLASRRAVLLTRATARSLERIAREKSE